MHVHSKQAYSILSSYQVGVLDGYSEDSTGSPTVSSAHHAHPDFIDISKPMFSQVWNNTTWTKQFYLENGIFF